MRGTRPLAESLFFGWMRLLERVAVFVDAGYLFAASGSLLAGRRATRSELSLDPGAAEDYLRTFAEREAGLPLLRIYWYDGTDSGPTADHTALMWTQNIKVRLGIVNSYGQQKGVDSLIISDMINLARTGGVATVILLTGDEDLRVGVQQAQEAGLRVHLLGIEPKRENQSNMLQQEADIIHEIGKAEVGRFLSLLRRPGAISVSIATTASRDEKIEAVAAAVVGALDTKTRGRLKADFEAGNWQIPRDQDRALIKTLGEYLHPIEECDKREMRTKFRELV